MANKIFFTIIFVAFCLSANAQVELKTKKNREYSAKARGKNK